MYNRKKGSNCIITHYTVDPETRVHTFYLIYPNNTSKIEVYLEKEVEDVFYFEPPKGIGDKYGRIRR